MSWIESAGDFFDNVKDLLTEDKGLLQKIISSGAGDVIKTVPVGKIVEVVIKKIIDKGDPDDAYRSLVISAYFASYLAAVDARKWRDVFPKDKSDIIGLGKDNLNKAEEFSLETFTDSPLFKEMQTATRALLERNKFPKDEISRIEKYIETHFRATYYKILDDRSETYASYQKYLKNRGPEERLLWLLGRYRSKLKSLYEEPILDDSPIALSHLYVKPNYKTNRNSFRQNKRKNEINLFEEEPYNIDTYPYNLHDYIKNWLSQSYWTTYQTPKGENKNSMLILFGQPGQGKTSFCKRVLHDILSKNPNENICYVRLRDIKQPRGLLADPLKVLYEHIKTDIRGFEENVDWKESDFAQSFLILDGLDELKLCDGFNANHIEAFCIEIYKELNQERYNKKMRVLLTSRLGYLELENIGQYYPLVLQIDTLTENQQVEWVDNYRKYDDNIKLNEDIVRELQYEEHIRELLEQPVLLHMVATANLDVTQAQSKITLYASLFDVLIERNYAQGPSPNLQELRPQKRKFRHFIQIVALQIYQSNKHCINKEELLKLIIEYEFNELLGKGTELKNSIKGVMMAFYFQQTADGMQAGNNNFAVEFYHKSLMEFLVAECIFEEITKLGKLDEFGEDEFNRKNVCETLFKLLSPKALSNEVVENLNLLFEVGREGYADEKLKDTRMRLGKKLQKTTPYLLERQMIPDNVGAEVQLIEKGITTFDGLLKIFSCLSPEINFQGLFQEQDTKTRFFQLTALLPHSGYRASLIKADLSKLDLEQIDLSECDFMETNLSETNLCGANLRGSDLYKANLSRANLSNSDLSRAFLNRACLLGADLSNSVLFRAAIINSDLTEANLERAILIGADLRRTKLISSNLEKANLYDVYLAKGDLSGASLENANLIEADLSEANLNNANFKKACLFMANLTGVGCICTDFNEADLRGAYTLIETTSAEDIPEDVISDIFRKFEPVHLTKSDLFGANLEGTVFDEDVL